MEKKIPVKTLYLLLVISIGLIGLGIGSTYALFTTSAEISNPITLGSNLTYYSDVLETVEVTVPAGSIVSSELKISNNSGSDLKYVTWYLDAGSDVDVVGENSSSQGTLASGATASVIVGVRNYNDYTITVNIGISSSSDSVVLGSGMNIVEDMNFLMSVDEDETSSSSSTFLSSSLTRGQISSITFVENNTVPSGYTSADVSKYSDGSILMWYGSANSSGYYDVYIGSSSGVTYIDSGYRLFSYLTNCTSIKFNNSADVSKVISMDFMFGYSSKLTVLDVSDWNTINVTSMSSMFYQCTLLTTIYASYSWSTVRVTNSTNMFQNCTSLVGGSGTAYNSSYVDATYAKIDDRETSSPGYLTYYFF